MSQPPVGNRVYDNEYFSGTQAGLYIGDVFVDEVIAYSYMTQQTKTPIYGYASQLFDAVAPGPVIVSGSFTINFKEANYLYIVLMRYQQFNRSVSKVLSDAAGGNSEVVKDFMHNVGLGQKRGGVSNIPSPFMPTTKKVLRQNIESILNGTATTGQRYNFYQSLSGYASINGLDLEFEDIAEVLEDSVWGIEASKFDDMVRRTDDNFFDGFDMYFTYGDYNNPGANHTVERINGVHLTSRAKEVKVSGEPILEEYQFIARNQF
jgi:hypothetical protein